MELEAMLFFKGKRVKLTYHNGFNLVGIVLEVYHESILFQTDQATSVIPLTDIYSVVERR